VEDLLTAIRHTLQEHINLQVSAARGQDWEHDRLPAEAHTEFMRIFNEMKARAESLVLADKIAEASETVTEAWKTCEALWKAALPPHGTCLEQDAGRHWFVVTSGTLRAYSHEHYGNYSFRE